MRHESILVKRGRRSLKRIVATATIVTFIAALMLEHFICLLCAGMCDNVRQRVTAKSLRHKCRACCASGAACSEDMRRAPAESKNLACILATHAANSLNSSCSCKKIPPQLMPIVEERRHIMQTSQSADLPTGRVIRSELDFCSLLNRSGPHSVHPSIATTVLRL